MMPSPQKAASDQHMKQKEQQVLTSLEQQNQNRTLQIDNANNDEEQRFADLYQAAKDENELLEFKNYELLFKIQELEQNQRRILSKLVSSGGQINDDGGQCEWPPEVAEVASGQSVVITTPAGGKKGNEEHELSADHFNRHHYRENSQRPAQFTVATPTTNSVAATFSFGGPALERKSPIVGEHNNRLTMGFIDGLATAAPGRQLAQPQQVDEKVGCCASEQKWLPLVQQRDGLRAPAEAGDSFGTPAARSEPAACNGKGAANTSANCSAAAAVATATRPVNEANSSLLVADAYQQHQSAPADAKKTNNSKQARIFGLHDMVSAEKKLGSANEGEIMTSAMSTRQQQQQLQRALCDSEKLVAGAADAAGELVSMDSDLEKECQLIEYNGVRQRQQRAVAVAVGAQVEATVEAAALISAAATLADRRSVAGNKTTGALITQSQPSGPANKRQAQPQEPQLQSQQLNLADGSGNSNALFAGNLLTGCGQAKVMIAAEAEAPAESASCSPASGLLASPSADNFCERHTSRSGRNVSADDDEASRPEIDATTGGHFKAHPSAFKSSSLSAGSGRRQLAQCDRPKSLVGSPAAASLGLEVSSSERRNFVARQASDSDDNGNSTDNMVTGQQAVAAVAAARKLSQEAKKLAQSQPNLAAAPQAAARRSTGGARIAMPVVRRPVSSGCHSNNHSQSGGTFNTSANKQAVPNYLRARSKSSLDQSSRLIAPAPPAAASGLPRRASGNIKHNQRQQAAKANGRTTQQTASSSSATNGVQQHQSLAPNSSSSSSSSNSNNNNNQEAARGAAQAGGDPLSAWSVSAPPLPFKYWQPAPSVRARDRNGRSLSLSCGFVTQIPTLISQSHAVAAAAASAAAVTAPTTQSTGAPTANSPAPQASAAQHNNNHHLQQQQQQQRYQSHNNQAQSQQQLRMKANSKSMSNLANVVVADAAAGKHYDDDELRGEDSSTRTQAQDEQQLANGGKRRSCSLLPKVAAPTNKANSASLSCVSFVGRDEPTTTLMEAHDWQREQQNDKSNNSDGNSQSNGLSSQCAQCKLFQSKVGLLIRDRKQLNEQISELEELENDSRLSAQKLEQQLVSCERQLETCKSELQRSCENESRLQFQNKRLSFELNERLDSIKQLQCQLARLQQQQQQQAAATKLATAQAPVPIVRSDLNNNNNDNSGSERNSANPSIASKVHSTRNESVGGRTSQSSSTAQSAGAEDRTAASFRCSQVRPSLKVGPACQVGATAQQATVEDGARSNNNNSSNNSSDDDSAIDLPEAATKGDGSCELLEAQRATNHHLGQSNGSNGGNNTDNSKASPTTPASSSSELKSDDSAYSKSSSSSDANSDDGNRSDSDLQLGIGEHSPTPSCSRAEDTNCNRDCKQQVLPTDSAQTIGSSASSSSSAAANSIGLVSSSSSGDESDHHESANLTLNSASANGSNCGVASEPSSAGNLVAAGAGAGALFTSRQQVLRKKISTARILRGIQVHQQQTSTLATSNAVSMAAANQLAGRPRQEQQDSSSPSPGYNSPSPSSSRLLVGQARLAQVVTLDSCNGQQQEATLGPTTTANSVDLRQSQAPATSVAGTKSFIDLALEGVEKLEKGNCTDEALKFLMIGRDGMKTTQVPSATKMQKQQQESTDNNNLVNKYKQEIVSLRMRLMQAQTLNDNLVSELKSSKDRALRSGQSEQQQQQQYYSRTSTFVNRQQMVSPMQMQRNSMLIEQSVGVSPINCQAIAMSPQVQSASAETVGSGQRSIIYVNGLRASVTHQQTTHISAAIGTSAHNNLDCGNFACNDLQEQGSRVANNSNSIDQHNYYNNNRQHQQYQSCPKCVIGSEQTAEFLRFLLNKVHFHHGRTFELVSECQKLAMNALLSSYSQQLDLAHHNKVILAGNQASLRALAGDSLPPAIVEQQQQQREQGPAIDQLYPVRPPPRRRNAVAHHQQIVSSSSVPDALAEPEQLQQQQQVNGNVDQTNTNEQKANNNSEEVQQQLQLPTTANVVQASSSSSTQQRASGQQPAVSALQVAKQTLLSIVPIYYNNNSNGSSNKEKLDSSSSSVSNKPTNGVTAADAAGGARSESCNKLDLNLKQQQADAGATANRAATIKHQRAAKTKSCIVLNQSASTKTPPGPVNAHLGSVNSKQEQNVSVLGINRNGELDRCTNTNTNTNISIGSNQQINSQKTLHFYQQQQQHLFKVKNSLNEDIERYRVHFNGQLLDLLTRQNWCESIITDKLKTYQPINVEWAARQRHHHDHARSTLAQSETCIHMMESNGAKVTNLINIRPSNAMQASNINFNRNDLVTEQQQRQSWGGDQSSASLC